MAADAGVDIGQITGSGREGRVLKEDVAAYLERQKPETRKPPICREKVETVGIEPTSTIA